MDLESSETAAKGMPGGEPTSGMADPDHEDISSSSSSSTNHICTTVDTSKEDTTAILKQQIITMALKVMRCEERNVFIGDLIRSGMGTKEVENFISNQEYLRREAGLGLGIKTGMTSLIGKGIWWGKL